MSKEKIEILNKCNNCKLKECIGCEITNTEIQEIKEYIEELEQKETILDKITEECGKQMTANEDTILEIFPQKILNIIEGEKK